MPTDDLITYDEINKILWTVPAAFNQRPEAVVSWVWRRGIEPEAAINAGTVLADIQWADNNREAVSAPDNCTGKVKVRNSKIKYENLHFAPPQSLLTFE
jgi:hypothetical protein